MAIDYTIDYQCVPKQRLGADGILERIKGRARAEAVIDLFRQHGDRRAAEDIGFELTRSTPDGGEETRVVMVKDLLEAASELSPLAHHCQGCPANAGGSAWGCMGQIEYPISRAGEVWLMNQLPVTEEPLTWLLLREGVREMASDGAQVLALRGAERPYFEETGTLARKLGEFSITNNQVFEMLFLRGHLTPAYAALLLLFFGAIGRDLEANDIMALSRSPEDAFERHPFRLRSSPDDDRTIAQFKQFFRALYLAWGLNVRLLLDV